MEKEDCLMEKLNDINEAISYMRQGDIVTGNGKDIFIIKNDRVVRYSEGTQYSLKIDDFIDLYKKNNFYLYEDSVEIEEEKDEAYYRYYKK